MSDLDEISLVLHYHRWETLKEWASKVDQLADLSDEQIDNLVLPRGPRT
jgi:hypothetical protein